MENPRLKIYKQACDEIKAEIDKATAEERAAIEAINELSPKDVRGKTPEISDQVRKLDEIRDKSLQRRRLLGQELTAARAAFEKARRVLAKIDKSRPVEADQEDQAGADAKSTA